MPLTAKGSEVMSAMQREYGAEKGKSVFYASKNAGKISGVEDRIDSALRAADALYARADAMQTGTWAEAGQARADASYLQLDPSKLGQAAVDKIMKIARNSDCEVSGNEIKCEEAGRMQTLRDLAGVARAKFLVSRA